VSFDCFLCAPESLRLQKQRPRLAAAIRWWFSGLAERARRFWPAGRGPPWVNLAQLIRSICFVDAVCPNFVPTQNWKFQCCL